MGGQSNEADRSRRGIECFGHHQSFPKLTPSVSDQDQILRFSDSHSAGLDIRGRVADAMLSSRQGGAKALFEIGL